MPTFSAAELRIFATTVFQAAGTPADVAATVAESLVLANLIGHDSHGVAAMQKYIGKIRSGDLIPDALPTLGEQRGGTANVDAHWGFGQIAAHFGADLVCKLLPQHGIACASLKQVNHIGRPGEYAQRIAEAGYIGLVMTAGAMRGGQVAPYGGRERRLGTNPIAWGIPLPGNAVPLVTDFATSGYAAGKVAVAMATGEDLPPGILIDREGNPTQNPTALDAGGALLPFGGHKGYGLALVIELIVSVLAGFAPASSSDWQQGNPTLIMALSIENFISRERYDQLAAELVDNIRRTPPAPGFSEVLLPGDLEQRTLAHRINEGIAIPETTWQQLTQLAASLGVNVS